MRINEVTIENFKNLQNFSIQFDENKMKTVLLGQNASGKSNFIEAVLLIFKFLDLSDSSSRDFPPFNYTIDYQIRNDNIKITCKNKKYIININGNKKSETYVYFFSDEAKKLYQPKYVFTYYSGLSNRLKEHFWKHQEKFYDKIIGDNFKDEELDSLRKLFYVQTVHSYFVLLSYFSFEDEETESVKFLNEVLDIKDIESILFILKKPKWAESGSKKNPHDKFWTAKGLVRKFLDVLWEYSLAPIYNSEKIQIDFEDTVSQDRLYLYISSKGKLKELAKNYKTNTGFFKALESMYISKMMEEVKIKVKKENIDGSITFKELSEGEQQLLTVLGLLKFTKDEESLILLDEPDTHLNPLWKWKYLEFLDNVVGRDDSTQIIINTHDPLLIGNLTKEEVRIFRKSKGKIRTEIPDVDPRGLGVAGILTSELFGLSTTLDPYTMNLLAEKMEISILERRLTEEERTRLREINNKLEEFGLNYDKRFPDIEECLKEKYKKNRGK